MEQTIKAEQAELEKGMNKFIIREVEPEATYLNFYFDDDGLTEASGDYCNTLFIVESRDYQGFNAEEYGRIQKELEDLFEEAWDIKEQYPDRNYSSVGELLLDNGLIKSIKDTEKIGKYKSLLFEGDYDSNEPDAIAEYLTLKTGEEWETASARGYCQGDYVEGVYCKDHYKNGIQNYLEVWLGCAREFDVIELDDDGEEVDRCGGYIVADSEAWTPEGIKTLVCQWAEIDEAKAELHFITGSASYTHYNYQTV